MKPISRIPAGVQKRIRKSIALGLAVGMGVCGIPSDVLYANEQTAIKSGVDYLLPEKQIEEIKETYLSDSSEQETSTSFLNSGPLTPVQTLTVSASDLPNTKTSENSSVVTLKGTDARNSGQDGWNVNGSSVWRSRSSEDYAETLKFDVSVNSSASYDLEISGKNFGQNLPPFYKTYLLDIYVDGNYAKTASLNASTQTQSVLIDLELSEGDHEIAIGWTNDYWVVGIFDANLQIDGLKLQQPPVVLPPDPLVNKAPVIDGGILSSVSDGDFRREGLQIKAGSTATYSAKASDPDGDPLQWAWSYSVNGGQPVLYKAGTGAVANASFTYPQNQTGTYNWILRVSDGHQEITSMLLVETFIPAASAPIAVKVVMQNLSVQSTGLSILAAGNVSGFDPIHHRAQVIVRNQNGEVVTSPLQINSDGTFNFSREMAAGSYEVEIKITKLIAGSTQEATLLSAKRTVTVTAPKPSIAINGIDASNISATGALIQFLTSSQAAARMRYGLKPGVYDLVSDGGMGNMLMTEHGIQLSGLKIGAAYYYVIEVTDPVTGNIVRSAEQSFTTLTPSVNVLTPQVNGDVTVADRTFEAVINYESFPEERTDVHSHFCVLPQADISLEQLDTMDRKFLAMDIFQTGKVQVSIPPQIQESGKVYLYSWAVEGTDMTGIKNTLKVRAINLEIINEPVNTKPVIEGGIRHNLTDDDPTREGLQVPAGGTVTYSAKAADADGDTLKWSWSYSVNGNAPVLFKSGNGPIESATFTYPNQALNYTWILKVSDGKEEVTATMLVETVLPQPPAPAPVEMHDLTITQEVTSLGLMAKISGHMQGFNAQRHKAIAVIKSADGSEISTNLLQVSTDGTFVTGYALEIGQYALEIKVLDALSGNAEVLNLSRSFSIVSNDPAPEPDPQPEPEPAVLELHDWSVAQASDGATVLSGHLHGFDAAKHRAEIYILGANSGTEIRPLQVSSDGMFSYTRVLNNGSYIAGIIVREISTASSVGPVLLEVKRDFTVASNDPEPVPQPVLVEVHELDLSQPVDALAVKMDSHLHGYSALRHKVEVELRNSNGVLIVKETLKPDAQSEIHWTKTVSAAGNYTVKVIVTDTVAGAVAGTRQGQLTVAETAPNPQPTPPPAPAVTVTNLVAGNITETGARIAFDTNATADYKIRYIYALDHTKLYSENPSQRQEIVFAWRADGKYLTNVDFTKLVGHTPGAPIHSEVQVLNAKNEVVAKGHYHEFHNHIHEAMDPNAEMLMTHHDKIPNFGKDYTAVNIASGNWSDASIWRDGIVPPQGAIVRIAKGTTIHYDVVSDAELSTVGVEGKLEFATNRSTRMRVTNMLVYETGELEVGTEAKPVEANVLAEMIINDSPLDIGTVDNPGKDVEQFGTGMIVFGKITMMGRQMAETYYTPTVEARAGDTKVTLSEIPSGWSVGDTIVFPDGTQSQIYMNSNYSSMFGEGEKGSNLYQGEERVITSISGNTVTFNQALLHNHLGAREPDGTLTMLNGKPLIAPIANLGRNIVVKSENAEGTRGHVMFHGTAEVDIRYAAFKDLGRTTAQPLDNTTFDKDGRVTHIGTNQIARYSFHFHHVTGPKPPTSAHQYRVEGNAIYGGKRWGLVVHGSHYGLIKDNIVYDIDGAGVTTEDGTEYGNIFDGNYVLRISGEPKNPVTVGHRDQGSSQIEGDGFWMQGTGNYFRNNIVGNVRGVGYNVFAATQDENTLLYKGFLVPAKPGDDPHSDGGIRFDEFSMVPVLEFDKNAVFGSFVGFETWRMRFSYPTTEEDTFKITNFVGWNTQRVIHIPFVTSGVDIDGLFARGKTLGLDNRVASMGLDIDAGYIGNLLKVKNFDVKGFDYGIRNSSILQKGWVLTDGVFQNLVNIDGGSFVFRAENRFPPSKELIFSSVTHKAMPGKPLRAFEAYPGALVAENTPIIPQWRVTINNHNGTGQNYQFFFDEQNPSFMIPNAQFINEFYGTAHYGCPAGSNMTNQQCWDSVGVAIGGEVAPCAALGDPTCSAAKALAASLGMKGMVVTYDGVSEAPLPTVPPQVLSTSLDAQDGELVIPLSTSFGFMVLGDRSAVKNLVLVLDGGAPERYDVTKHDPSLVAALINSKTYWGVGSAPHVLAYYLEDLSGREIAGSRKLLNLNTPAPLPPPVAPNPSNPTPPPPPAPVVPKIVTAESFTAVQMPATRNMVIEGQLIGFEPARHTAKIEIRTAANVLIDTVVLSPDANGVFSFTQSAMSPGEFIARLIVGDTVASNAVVLDKTKAFTVS